MEGALSELREVIGEDNKELAEREARELRRQRFRHLDGPRFALDDGAAPDPARAMSPGAAPVRAALSRFGRAIGHLVGGQDFHDRMRTATLAREVLERSKELKRDWNRQVERAAEEGVHVIYTDGYDRLHKELDTVSKNMLLDYRIKSEISAVLAQLGNAVSNREYFDTWRDLMVGQMNRREALEVGAAEWGVAVPGHEDYDTWRNVIDFAVGRCEGLMDDPGNYGIHLDYIARATEPRVGAPVSLDPLPVSERSVSRRTASARKEGAAFAARRSSFASSLASLSLRRQDLKRDFYEPASLRAATSAQRSSSARASAASARTRSRSARAGACSYSICQSRGGRTGSAAGDDRTPPSPSTGVRSAPKSSSRTAMQATIAHGKTCYQPPCGA